MGSLFAAQASPSLHTTGAFHRESQPQSSKEAGSTFRSQLAAQVDPESDGNVGQGPADPSDTPGLVSGRNASTNVPTPLIQAKSSPWNASTRQIAGKSAVASNTATISPAPLPKMPDGTQPAQKPAPRNTEQAQSGDELSRPDPAADLNSTTPIDLTSISFFNSFANVAPAAIDSPPGNANPSDDKSVKSAAVRSSTPEDLSISQPQNAPKNERTEVAFAVRVSTDRAPNPSPQESGDSVSLRLAPGDRTASSPPEGRGAFKSSTIGQTEFAPAEIPREASSSIQAGKSTEPQSAGTTAKADSEPSAATADTVKVLNLRMNAGGEQHVAIRVIERSGELSVSVRSADPVLTRTLQDRMPELTSRLEDQQIQADTWVPRSGESASSRDEGFHSPQDQSQQYDTGGNRGRRQQRQPRPEWVQELESIAPNSRI